MRLAPLTLFLCAFAWASAPAHAQPSRLAGFDLLRVTPSARGAALAGAYTPGAPSADAALYNPAFLEEGAHDRVAFGYLNHLADVWLGTAAYARHEPRLAGTLGVAVRHLGYGDFERTTIEGGVDGRFGASETVLTLSYARPVAPGVRAGANLHAAFVTLEEASASAIAADLGVTYTVPEQGLVLSAALRNAGAVLNHLGATDDRLAPDLRLTVSKRLENVPFRISLTGYDLLYFEGASETALSEAARHLAVGGEFLFGQAFAVRLGYDHRRRDELSTGERLDLAGLGVGFGLDLRRFGFDYAYNAWSSFGGLHHLTLRAQL